MKVTRPPVSQSDIRGTITDIAACDIHNVTLITTTAGSRRGDHYHEHTRQLIYVLTGELHALAQQPGCDVASVRLTPGCLLENDPNERHALIAITDASFLVLTHGPRGGGNYELDTYRVAPLSADGINTPTPAVRP